ncbi:MAG: hypothetical protein CMJ26_06495 [Phycisphaerae bacterium]|nr:hypothetical protein [Phycisphaerae bacterium]
MRLYICFTTCALCCATAFGDVSTEHGYFDLTERLGAGNEPTGVGIEVAQVEAVAASGGYAPDENNPLFLGKTFVLRSGSSVISNHATQVGMRLYGTSASGIAQDIDLINVYNAEGWATTEYLRVGTGSNPSSPPGDTVLINNSWTATFGSVATDTQALRRADWSIDQHDVMMLSGVANTGAHAPLMSFGFNCVSVGKQNGEHVSGTIPSGYDLPGRQLPLIVASQGSTSNAAGVVSAIVALLVETRETHPNTSSNYFAGLSETMKSCLLTGGNHLAGWTNNTPISGANRGRTTQPIDEVYGVGTANVDRAHRVLTGGQHASSGSSSGLSIAPNAAWETWTIGHNQSRFIKFDVASLADEVSIVLTWHQLANSGFGSYSLANLDLILWKEVGGTLVDITGDAGLDVFSAGNVVSESAVDNVEHLYIEDLAIGEYVLEVKRIDSLGSSRAFSVGWLFPEQTTVPGDVNGDGVIDVNDILALIVAWGPCNGCPEDLDGSGSVNVSDLIQLISYW